jgi:hypothetical protein
MYLKYSIYLPLYQIVWHFPTLFSFFLVLFLFLNSNVDKANTWKCYKFSHEIGKRKEETKPTTHSSFFFQIKLPALHLCAKKGGRHPLVVHHKTQQYPLWHFQTTVSRASLSKIAFSTFSIRFFIDR